MAAPIRPTPCGLYDSRVWQASGIAMTIMIASFRSIDQDIWKTMSADGVPE
jgi:ABC-type sugar transport system permease subunit